MYCKFLLLVSSVLFFETHCGANVAQKDNTAIDSRVAEKIASENLNNGGRYFAIVDLKKIASESKAGKAIEKQIAEINNESKKDLLDLESKIKLMESDKKTDSDTRKIEDMHLILYDMVRTKRYEISEAYRIAISILDKKIKEAIREVSQKNEIKIVIASDAIVYTDEQCPDITNEIVTLVDKICSSIKVELKELKQ